MTSRSLFINLLKNENRNKIWYPIMIFIVLFLPLETSLLMKLQEIELWPKRYSYNKIHYFANDFLSPDKNIPVTVCVCTIAVITAFFMFSYVQSRTMLDSIHSMPVKRKTIFFAKYLCGFEFFIVPFILQMCATFVVAACKDSFSRHALNNFIMFFAVLCILFLCFYSFTIICIMLCGNFVISLVATLCLIGYSYIITMLKCNLVSNFLHTSVYRYINPLPAFTPADMVSKLYSILINYRNYNSGITYRTIITYMLLIVLATVIYTGIAYALYKNRKTESAGNAIAFKRTEGLVKCIVVIPVSLFAGFFIRDLSSTYSFSWFVFGVIFAFILSCITLEIIFRFDFKAWYNHWCHILFNGVCLALIILAFKADVFGFNTYVPSRQEIDYISVSIDYLFDVQPRITENMFKNPIEYRMENVKLYDDNTYSFVSFLAKQGLTYEEEYTSEAYEGSDAQKELIQKQKDFHTITCGYHLKNGKVIYRCYYYDLNDENSRNLVASIFNSHDYKVGSIPLLKNGWNKNINSVEIDTNYDANTIQLSEKEKNELLNIYQKELLSLTFDEAVFIRPEASFGYLYKAKNLDYNFIEDGYLIYPSFEKTIGFFEERGLNFDEEVFMNSINTLLIYNYRAEDSESFEITDEEEIREIINNCFAYDIYNDISCYSHKSYDIDVDITYIDKEGDKAYKYLTFYNDNIPEFLRKRLDLQ